MKDRKREDQRSGIIENDLLRFDGHPSQIVFTRRGWKFVAAFFAVAVAAALIWPPLWCLVAFLAVVLLLRNSLPWLPDN